jgi:hypothetical protein
MKKLVRTMVISLLVVVGSVGINLAQITLPEVIINRPEGLTRVIASFNKLFKDAREPRWYYGGTNYAVTFLWNDLKYNALFMQNGHLVYQISYGNENIIPSELKGQVFDRFKGYHIISVINVQQNGRNIWHIIGEGKHDFLNVTVEEGVMSDGWKSKKYERQSTLVSG